MSMWKKLRTIPLALAAVALMWSPSRVARAAPNPYAFPYFSLSESGVFNQGPGGVSPQQFDFSLAVEVGTVYGPPTLTYPGPGSPQSIPPFFGNFYYLQQSFPTQSAFDAAYPTGTYTVTSTNPNISGPASKSVTVGSGLYPTVVPQLTAGTYQGLQGLDASQPFSLSFNSFPPDPLTTSSYTYLTITDVPTGTIVTSAQLSSNSTGYSLKANTLAPHRQYLLDLYFINDTYTTVDFDQTDVGADYDTEVMFTTGPAVVVPEPGCLTLAGVALAAAGVWRRAAGRQKRTTGQAR